MRHRCRGLRPQLRAGRDGDADDGDAVRHSRPAHLRRGDGSRRAGAAHRHRRTGRPRRQHVRRRRRLAVGEHRRRPRVDVRPRRRHRLVQRRRDIPRQRLSTRAGLDPCRGVGQRLHLRRRAGDRCRPRRQRRVIVRPATTRATRSRRRDVPPSRPTSCPSAGEHHVRHRHVRIDGHPRAPRPRAVVTGPARAQSALRRHDRHRHLRRQRSSAAGADSRRRVAAHRRGHRHAAAFGQHEPRSRPAARLRDRARRTTTQTP